jgi:hypothetical protein
LLQHLSCATDGWSVLDDNLLACSDGHIKNVFAMLSRQNRRPFFTGGLEVAKLKPWYVTELAKLKPAEMFFAYDTPNDREPLYEAGKMLAEARYGKRARQRKKKRFVITHAVPASLTAR